MRFIVEEAVTRKILSRDLYVEEPSVTAVLSGPAEVNFKVPYRTSDIEFKAYGQFIHVEDEDYLGNRIIVASAIVQPSDIDPESGALNITAKGFSAYPDGIPWLENWQEVAPDPFHIVHRIWNHIQSQANGHIGVTVTPASSGTFLLPGFGWDGSKFNLELFGVFIRSSDLKDCYQEMIRLARDIPFDITEVSVWNPARTAVDRELKMEYPRRGGKRFDLAFRMGENVLSGTPEAEVEVDWVSSVIVRGWWPGSIYQGIVSNADPTRFRRTMLEEDASLNSRERADIRAKRKLTKVQIPKHWSEITLDKYHTSAPFGTYRLGDDILVQGNLPWTGDISEWHRIMSITDDDSGRISLSLKHVNSMNYDPLITGAG